LKNKLVFAFGEEEESITMELRSCMIGQGTVERARIIKSAADMVDTRRGQSREFTEGCCGVEVVETDCGVDGFFSGFFWPLAIIRAWFDFQTAAQT
jgi:hypothetical protein